MYPVLFKIGHYSVLSYTALVAIGFLFFVVFFVRSFKKEGMDVYPVIFWSLMGFVLAFLVSHLVFIVFHLSAFKEFYAKYGWKALFPRSGLSFHGGVLGGVAALYFLAKEIKRNFFEVLDKAAVFAPLLYAAGRMGCFFNGCCHGNETFCPLGIIYPLSSLHPEDMLTHPVQLYDSFLNIGLFFVLLEVSRKKKFHGHIFCFFIIGNSVIRFFMEYFRFGASTEVVGGYVSIAQLACVVIVAAGVILMKVLERKEFRKEVL